MARGWGSLRHTPRKGVGVCIRSTRLARSSSNCCGGLEVSHPRHFEEEEPRKSKPYFEHWDFATGIDNTRFVRQ